MPAIGERVRAVEADVAQLKNQMGKLEIENKEIKEMLNEVENNSLITREAVISLKGTNEQMLAMLQTHDEHLNQWIGRRDFVKIAFTAIGAIAATVGILAAFNVI